MEKNQVSFRQNNNNPSELLSKQRENIILKGIFTKG